MEEFGRTGQLVERGPTHRTLPSRAERLASDGRIRNGSGDELVAPCVVYIRYGREERRKEASKSGRVWGGEPAKLILSTRKRIIFKISAFDAA